MDLREPRLLGGELDQKEVKLTLKQASLWLPESGVHLEVCVWGGTDMVRSRVVTQIHKGSAPGFLWEQLPSLGGELPPSLSFAFPSPATLHLCRSDGRAHIVLRGQMKGSLPSVS